MKHQSFSFIALYIATHWQNMEELLFSLSEQNSNLFSYLTLRLHLDCFVSSFLPRFRFFLLS